MKEKVSAVYHKYKLAIYPTLVGLASLVLLTTVIYPQIRAFFSDRASLRRVEDRLQVLTVKAETLERVSGEDLGRKLELSLTALPIERDYALLIGSLQRISVNSGISLEALAVGQQSAAPLGGTTSFTVKAEVIGPKSTLSQLMTTIEKTPPVMKVVGIEVSNLGSDRSSATLTIEVFYSPAPNMLGAVDEALPQITEEEEKLLVTLAGVTPAQTTPTATTLLPRGKPNPFE